MHSVSFPCQFSLTICIIKMKMFLLYYIYLQLYFNITAVAVLFRATKRRNFKSYFIFILKKMNNLSSTKFETSFKLHSHEIF
jgi:hypothetical protein